MGALCGKFIYISEYLMLPLDTYRETQSYKQSLFSSEVNFSTEFFLERHQYNVFLGLVRSKGTTS